MRYGNAGAGLTFGRRLDLLQSDRIPANQWPNPIARRRRGAFVLTCFPGLYLTVLSIFRLLQTAEQHCALLRGTREKMVFLRRWFV